MSRIKNYPNQLLDLLILLYLQTMGQVLQSDQSSQMKIQPASLNVTEKESYVPLVLARGVQTLFFQKVFQYQNYKKLQVAYKFFPDVFIHLQLTKEKAKQEPGYPLNIGNELVYGYKFKKNQKSDKIRPDKIYFRRKIFIANYELPIKTAYRQKLKNHIKGRRGREEDKKRQSKPKNSNRQKVTYKNNQTSKQQLLRTLAEIKLLSKLEIGAKIGRMVDGTDGILTEHYIQFYSEVPINKGEFEERETSQKDNLCQTLQKKKFRVKKSCIEMAYSVVQKGYILKQLKKSTVEQDLSENRSIKYMVRQFEQQVNRAITKLDGITNMMTAIQNSLSQRDIERAMEKFEQNMSSLEQSDRIVYAEQMNQLLGKYNYYKNYERQVSSYISSSRSSMAESRNLSHSRFNPRSIKSDHPEDSTDSYEGNLRTSTNVQDSFQGNMSPRSTAPFKLSDQETNKSEHDVSLGENSNRHSTHHQSNYLMWQSALERLKNSILDNNKVGINQSLTCLKNLGVLPPVQVEIMYGQQLMENAKTKHAKIIFQRILYFKKEGGLDYLRSEIHSMLGFLAHSRGQFKQSLSHYQKSLTLKLKLRNYSRKTFLAFNNMAVLSYYQEQYQKSVLYLHRGMRLGEYCPDYQLLMRSNYAMFLAEQGQIKQAKLEMYKTYRNVEPYSNNQIVCKFYSNLGYFDLMDNLIDKARGSFESACQIQQKFLIPNGYRPSLILHNNFAMYHYKRAEWRKAAGHLQKIENQLSQVYGMQAIQIHFNFGKVYKQLYNYDTAIKHFTQSRHLLQKMQEKYVVKYRQKIEFQIEKIEALRIDEVSQESSYANKLSRISKSLLSNKHIEVKMG